MAEKDISEHACLDLLEKFPTFWPSDKILEGANSIQKLAQTIGVIGDCDEGQSNFKSVQSFVDQTILKQVKDSENLFIILSNQDDTLNELNFLHVLSLLAYQTGDTACLEEITNRYQDHAGVGYLMITLGVMLHHRMKYKQSETCFLKALSCFQHENDHLGSAVATVNLAAFYKLSGDYQKAQSSCDDAAVLCHNIMRITTRDVHLPWKVLRRVASLLKEFGNYKSYHSILSIGAKCDIGSDSDSSTVKHMKQLITLQLKEQLGEQMDVDELKEFVSQLFVLLDLSHRDAHLKKESLNADLITTVVVVAKMCCDVNCLEEACKLIKKLESTFLQVHGGNCSLYGLLLYQIGHFKVNYGHPSEAESTLQQAEEILIHYFGRGYHMVASCKSLLGTCAMRKGDKKAAFSYLREAETIFKKINPHHPDVAEILLKVAHLYSEEGNFQTANLNIQKALEVFKIVCSEVSPQTAICSSVNFLQIEDVEKTSPCSSHIADGAQQPTNSLLSPGSTSSLNSVPASPSDDVHEKTEFVLKSSPYLVPVEVKQCHAKVGTEKETGKESFSGTSSVSHSSRGSIHFHACLAGKSSCEDGLISEYRPDPETKGNVLPGETLQETKDKGQHGVQSVHTCYTKEESGKGHGREFGEIPGPSFATVEVENDEGTINTGSLVSELQDEVACLQDQGRELREEIRELKEKWKQSEQEKQDLQAEVGRQLFLESKEKCRSEKILQPTSEHSSEWSRPCRARGAGPLDKSEKLGVPSHDKTSDEMQENIENARGTEVNEDVSGCKSFSGNSSNSEGDIAALTDNSDFENSSESSSLADIGNAGLSSQSSGLDASSSQSSSSSAVSVQPLTTDTKSSSVTSQDACGGTARFTLNCHHSPVKIRESSGESAFAATSSGQEIHERSVSSLTTDDKCESGEMSGGCAAKDENSKEISHSSVGLCNGAVKPFHLNCYFGANNVPGGPLCSPDRAQESLNLEHVAGVKQDALPDGDVTENQNGPGARIGGHKDTVGDQTDSNLRNQSNKWEHLGARPRDRPPREDGSSEAVSIYSSIVDLVPQQVTGPMASGVADAFLARHSEDKHLHGSLYYSNTEKVFVEDSSLQEASYVDGMMNLNDSNKAKPYFGDCQVASRPDPYYTSHFPVLPLTGRANDRSNGDGGNPYNNKYNSNSGLLPGPSSSYFGGSNFQGNGSYSSNNDFNALNTNLFRSDFALGTTEPQVPQNGHFTSSQRNQLLQSEFPGSGFNSDLLGAIGPQLTHSVIGAQRNNDFRETTLLLSSEFPQTQIASATNLRLLRNPSASTRTNDYFPNGSTGLPTSSSVARSNASDSRRLSGLESSRISQMTPGTERNRNSGTESVVEQRCKETNSTVERVFVEIEETQEFDWEMERKERGIRAETALKKKEREVQEGSKLRSRSNVLNPFGDGLVSGSNREGSSAGNSSSSCLLSGASTEGNPVQRSGQSAGSVMNRNYGTESVESTDNSLIELEQRVEEACAMMERVLREREEREEFGREIERKECEIRAERARKKREREARELQEASGWPQQQEPITAQPQWLCEHYQRHCRVRFPCCTHFYSCHRCHNYSKACDNEEAKASHATHLKCSYCQHEQEIGEDSAKCRSCGAMMSAYFCEICRHFASIDRNPYHCEKCGICRLNKDKSFHCEVCNICLDEKHTCRPNSGHDQCYICLEDTFSGCQILPCSHKLHSECLMAMIQNGIRTCPVCRRPVYSPAPE